jgi:hypothetical protein
LAALEECASSCHMLPLRKIVNQGMTNLHLYHRRSLGTWMTKGTLTFITDLWEGHVMMKNIEWMFGKREVRVGLSSHWQESP